MVNVSRSTSIVVTVLLSQVRSHGRSILMIMMTITIMIMMTVIRETTLVGLT